MGGAEPLGAAAAVLAAPYLHHQPGRCTARSDLPNKGKSSSFRYALPQIAHRHLEQIVSASILASDDGHENNHDLDPSILRELAEVSMRHYRGLIEDDDFWPWFSASAPIEAIAGLPIASRPVSRGTTGVGFNSKIFAAIPWVFSWIQMRVLVPGWFGLGTALEQLDASKLKQFKAHAKTDPFINTVLQNAAQEMARVRLPIARLYAEGGPLGAQFAERIEEEFTRASKALLNILDQPTLLSHAPAIEHAIQQRNPWTDILNLIQIECLRRQSKGEDHPQLNATLQAAVNGIAAAMQSTG